MRGNQSRVHVSCLLPVELLERSGLPGIWLKSPCIITVGHVASPDSWSAEWAVSVMKQQGFQQMLNKDNRFLTGLQDLENCVIPSTRMEGAVKLYILKTRVQ